MRLLHTRRWEFREFYDDEVPRYAILSHRWEEDELTYHDAQSRSSDWENFKDNSLTKGELKVLAARGQASSDGFQWIWIDSCCIDKSSSAELGEAINSMFEWYKQAKVCYAYLSDVHSFYEFERSQWFKRGWTLQELLAPRWIKFFGTKSSANTEWLYLGSKTEHDDDDDDNDDEKVLDKLVSTTGIPRSCLMYSPNIFRQPVAIRMSWASRRRTTRIEDGAYCLLGLFEVNMPLIYGEGKKAFRRLQEEIIKVTDDESIFAHNGGGSPSWHMLAQDPDWFADINGIGYGMPENMRYIKAGSKPYTATNKGLQITLPFIQMMGSRIAVLNCHFVGSGTPCFIKLACEPSPLQTERWFRLSSYRNSDDTYEFETVKAWIEHQFQAHHEDPCQYETMYIVY